MRKPHATQVTQPTSPSEWSKHERCIRFRSRTRRQRAGRTGAQRRAVGRRAGRSLDRADRETQSAGERGHPRAFRARSRRSARPAPGWSLSRRADRAEGSRLRARTGRSYSLGNALSARGESSRGVDFVSGCEAARGGLRRRGSLQRARDGCVAHHGAGRIRRDAQPVGSHPFVRRFERRRGRGGRIAYGADRARERRRWFDPQPGESDGARGSQAYTRTRVARARVGRIVGGLDPRICRHEERARLRVAARRTGWSDAR